MVTILYKDYLRFHLAWIASASREYPQIYKSPFASMVRIIVFVIEGTFLVEGGGGGGIFEIFGEKKSWLSHFLEWIGSFTNKR